MGERSPWSTNSRVNSHNGNNLSACALAEADEACFRATRAAMPWRMTQSYNGREGEKARQCQFYVQYLDGVRNLTRKHENATANSQFSMG